MPFDIVHNFVVIAAVLQDGKVLNLDFDLNCDLKKKKNARIILKYLFHLHFSSNVLSAECFSN